MTPCGTAVSTLSCSKPGGEACKVHHAHASEPILLRGDLKRRVQGNGLPQGSVLALILFNVYIADYPPTTSRK